MKSYICPSCKEKQTTIIEWETVSVGYEFNLKTGESEEVDKAGGDFEAFACPGCGEDLPEDMWEKFHQTLFG